MPDFHDSPLAHSDMAASGSSQLAPVTETAIDDDYELIHVETTRPQHDPRTTRPQHDPQTTRPHHDPVTTRPHHDPQTTRPQHDPVTTRPQHDPETTRPQHDPVEPGELGLDVRAHSPVISSLHPSRHASPAPSDSSVSRHHTPVEPRPGSRGAVPRTHKPPPPPPPPRRHHVEDDVPALAFDPFESLPPPAELMMHREELDEEDMEDAPVTDTDELHYDDEPHPPWRGSRPTDL